MAYKNKDDIAAYEAAYMDDIAAYLAAWPMDVIQFIEAVRAACAAGAANKEKIKALRATHRAEHNEKAAAYRAAHKEEIAAYMKAYRKAHPEETSAKMSRRRARELQAEGTHTAGDIRDQYTRQKGKCFWCGGRVGKQYHVDHVVPLSRGGGDGPDNLVIACAACNLQKGDKLPHEWAKGGRLL